MTVCQTVGLCKVSVIIHYLESRPGSTCQCDWLLSGWPLISVSDLVSCTSHTDNRDSVFSIPRQCGTTGSNSLCVSSAENCKFSVPQGTMAFLCLQGKTWRVSKIRIFILYQIHLESLCWSMMADVHFSLYTYCIFRTWMMHNDMDLDEEKQNSGQRLLGQMLFDRKGR